MLKKGLTVLVVDDDLINLKLIKSMLMKSDYTKEVIEAENGSQAINKLKSRDGIDLILLDIIMPVMGGIEMLKIVRADDNLSQLPIIVLTTDESNKSEALKYGANEFLIKPIKKDELMKKIAAVIA